MHDIRCILNVLNIAYRLLTISCWTGPGAGEERWPAPAEGGDGVRRSRHFGHARAGWWGPRAAGGGGGGGGGGGLKTRAGGHVALGERRR